VVTPDHSKAQAMILEIMSKPPRSPPGAPKLPSLLYSSARFVLDSQIRQSFDFYKEVQGRTDAPILVTGHSLGAAKADFLSGKYNVPSVTFEGPWMPVTALDRHGLDHVGHS
jgi:Lipase (class 3)